MSGAPGTAITVTGSGFDPAAQVACTVLVPTVFVNATTLTATIPDAFEGAPGASLAITVFVLNPDSSISNMVVFAVLFQANRLQAWTTVEQVCEEISGFQRGGQVSDDIITRWMVAISQTVSSALLRRGLPLDPTLWAQPDAKSAAPTGIAVLEQITRAGVAAKLASAISAQFTGGAGQWGFATNLQAAYNRDFQLLTDGHYDKLFQPSASTVETGKLVSGGEIFTRTGDPNQAFRKEQIF